ncbi:PaREP1 family protein [Caldivirga sp.]|uniref:PaREP1 family protein n=1 Tax=Caldivirga sp. TaxID=2080243 RepID=UPI0025B7E40D|nr:PaREP1 family protein [Caldivirga sp.]
MEISRVIYEKIQELGLDLEDLVAYSLIRFTSLDPGELARARVELAERYLNEAREYLTRGDAVQASEKLYKAVEEAVKALAEEYNVPEYQQAVKEGRWFAYLLGRAARTLSVKLNEPRITYAWSIAYDLHIWGFHEGKYGVDYVKIDIPHVEWLINYTKQLLYRQSQAG